MFVSFSLIGISPMKTAKILFNILSFQDEFIKYNLFL